MPTRKELMQELNQLLNVERNWKRLNLLDLTRLVKDIKKRLVMTNLYKEIEK